MFVGYFYKHAIYGFVVQGHICKKSERVFTHKEYDLTTGGSIRRSMDIMQTYSRMYSRDRI